LKTGSEQFVRTSATCCFKVVRLAGTTMF
jgi:hypothetical protein